METAYPYSSDPESAIIDPYNVLIGSRTYSMIDVNHINGECVLSNLIGCAVKNMISPSNYPLRAHITDPIAVAIPLAEYCEKCKPSTFKLPFTMDYNTMIYDYFSINAMNNYSMNDISTDQSPN